MRTLLLIRHMHKGGMSTRRIGRGAVDGETCCHPKVVLDLCRRPHTLGPA